MNKDRKEKKGRKWEVRKEEGGKGKEDGKGEKGEKRRQDKLFENDTLN